MYRQHSKVPAKTKVRSDPRAYPSETLAARQTGAAGS